MGASYSNVKDLSSLDVALTNSYKNVSKVTSSASATGANQSNIFGDSSANSSSNNDNTQDNSGSTIGPGCLFNPIQKSIFNTIMNSTNSTEVFQQTQDKATLNTVQHLKDTTNFANDLAALQKLSDVTNTTETNQGGEAIFTKMLDDLKGMDTSIGTIQQNIKEAATNAITIKNNMDQKEKILSANSSTVDPESRCDLSHSSIQTQLNKNITCSGTQGKDDAIFKPVQLSIVKNIANCTNTYITSQKFISDLLTNTDQKNETSQTISNLIKAQQAADKSTTNTKNYESIIPGIANSIMYTIIGIAAVVVIGLMVFMFAPNLFKGKGKGKIPKKFLKKIPGMKQKSLITLLTDTPDFSDF